MRIEFNLGLYLLCLKIRINQAKKAISTPAIKTKLFSPTKGK